ncbi:MAG: ABC transporter ATP-binding protein [Propionibacteriaceae bacterium]
MTLTITGLRFNYGQTKVLQGVDLSVTAGSFCGILGPNGCGKSTLLKCLIGFLRPAAGSITLDKADLRRIPAARRADMLGYVSQSGAVSGAGAGLTVYDTIALGARRRPPQDRSAAIADAVDRLGLEPYVGRQLRELSGGQAQRVQLARVLAQGVSTILLDEPISNLDLRYQVHVMDILHDLAVERGVTVIAVLHDLNFALQYCDEVAIVHQGQIAVQGNPATVLTPAVIENAFETPVTVAQVAGRPVILPRQGKTHHDIS